MAEPCGGSTPAVAPAGAYASTSGGDRWAGVRVKSGAWAADPRGVPVPETRGPRSFAATIDAARSGDPRAFDELVRRVERPLVGFLRARGASDPEGLANETLVRVFRAIGGFTGGEVQFRAWVFTVARNLVIDDHRRRSRRPDARPTDPTTLPEVPAADPDRLEQRERADQLLSLLTDEQREVIVLRVIAGLSVEETAEVVGRRPGAVRALQHRALSQLRRQLARRA